MKKGYGQGIYAGVNFGKLYYIEEASRTAVLQTDKDADKKIEDFKNAANKTLEQMQNIIENGGGRLSKEEISILEGHIMLVSDMLFHESVEKRITNQGLDTVAAVLQSSEEFAKLLQNMDDSYMKERAADVTEVADRIIANLQNIEEIVPQFDKPVILACHDLSLSMLLQLDKSKLLGIMTKTGTLTSHTAIVAKSLQIPTVIGCNLEVSKEDEGSVLLVDGRNGVCILDPDEAMIQDVEELKKQEIIYKKKMLNLIGKENLTLDGKKIDIFANIEGINDISNALHQDAGGIGLFRTEFLFLGRNSFPSEEEQFHIYKAAAEKMNGKKVVIRTLDIGADKQTDYFNLSKEANPAMGMRGIRICLTNPEIFKTQLRAIYRASAYGNIAIMFPMISSLGEVDRILNITENIRKELGLRVDELKKVELGVMIETPAAVMIAEELAQKVDFFSVGTNDLTQYTLAVDRQNEALKDFYDAHHPAILRMLRMVADAACNHNIHAGICGELAADTKLTRTFIQMGYSQLSVSAGSILEIRETVRKITIK